MALVVSRPGEFSAPIAFVHVGSDIVPSDKCGMRL
jgi:hypothetical protein